MVLDETDARLVFKTAVSKRYNDRMLNFLSVVLILMTTERHAL